MTRAESIAEDNFQRYWSYYQGERTPEAELVARKVFADASKLMRNKMLGKAQELITRPKVHPTQAVIEALQYAGCEIPPQYTFESIQAETARQTSALFGDEAAQAAEHKALNEMLAEREQEESFHRSRRMFYVAGSLQIARENCESSHKAWMGHLSNWEVIVRGYADHEGVYIYRGSDFTATDEDLAAFLPYLSELQQRLHLSGDLPVYAGLRPGKVGEKWKPAKCAGTIAQLGQPQKPSA